MRLEAVSKALTWSSKACALVDWTGWEAPPEGGCCCCWGGGEGVVEEEEEEGGGMGSMGGEGAAGVMEEAGRMKLEVVVGAGGSGDVRAV